MFLKKNDKLSVVIDINQEDVAIAKSPEEASFIDEEESEAGRI